MSAFAALWEENLDDEWEERGDRDDLWERYGWLIDDASSVLHRVVSEIACEKLDVGYRMGLADGRREADAKSARAVKRAEKLAAREALPAPVEAPSLFDALPEEVTS